MSASIGRAGDAKIDWRRQDGRDDNYSAAECSSHNTGQNFDEQCDSYTNESRTAPDTEVLRRGNGDL